MSSFVAPSSNQAFSQRLVVKCFKQEYKGVWGRLRAKIQKVGRTTEHDGIATAKVQLVIDDPTISEQQLPWKALYCSNLNKVVLKGLEVPIMMVLRLSELRILPVIMTVTPEKVPGKEPRRRKKVRRRHSPTPRSEPEPEPKPDLSKPSLITLPSELLKLVAGFLPLPSYAALLSTHSSLRCDIDHSSVFEQLAKSRFGKDYLDDFYSRVKNKDLTWKEKLRSQLQGSSKQATTIPKAKPEDFGLVLRWEMDIPTTLERKRDECGCVFDGDCAVMKFNIQSPFNKSGELPDSAKVSIPVLPDDLLANTAHSSPLLSRSRLLMAEVDTLRKLKAAAVKENYTTKPYGKPSKHLDAFLKETRRMFGGNLVGENDDNDNYSKLHIGICEYATGLMVSLGEPEVEDVDEETVFYESLYLPTHGNVEISFSMHMEYFVKDGDVVCQVSPCTTFQSWDEEGYEPNELDGSEVARVLRQYFRSV